MVMKKNIITTVIVISLFGVAGYLYKTNFYNNPQESKLSLNHDKNKPVAANIEAMPIAKNRQETVPQQKMENMIEQPSEYMDDFSVKDHDQSSKLKNESMQHIAKDRLGIDIEADFGIDMDKKMEEDRAIANIKSDAMLSEKLISQGLDPRSAQAMMNVAKAIRMRAKNGAPGR